MKRMHSARLTLTSRVDERPRTWGNRRLAPADPGAPSLKDPEQVSKESSVLSAVPQPVVAQLTRAAIFLVVTINSGKEDAVAVRAVCGDLAALLRAVGFRDLEGRLSCIMAFGSNAWDRLFGAPKPKDLHPFREIHGRHHAVATPGDILFHIRSTRMDLCFELATQIMSRLSGAVATVDEVHGFNYFDDRDLIGFVDGTENPVDQAALNATIIGEEDATFAGGSYVIVQKYLHNLHGWNALPIEEQERVVFQKWRWALSYCPSKGIAVHKQAKDDVVHLGRF